MSSAFFFALVRQHSPSRVLFPELVDELTRDRRNLVVGIKPIAYQLQGITELMGRYRERDKKTFVIESLWKFLLISEIANTVAQMILERPTAQMDDDETALMQLMDRNDEMLRKDFSIRLERCVEALYANEQGREGERSIEQDHISISESLHEGLYSELRLVLGKILKNKKRVAVLVDNLDKAWDRKS